VLDQRGVTLFDALQAFFPGASVLRRPGRWRRRGPGLDLHLRRVDQPGRGRWL